MFDVGWTEIVVVGCVAILVVGPKELPGMLRTFGKTVGNMRRMAGDFQRQFNDALKEAELDEVQKAAAFKPLEDARRSAEDFQNSIKKSVEEVGEEIGEATRTDKPETEASSPPNGLDASAKAKPASTGSRAKTRKPAAAKTARSRAGGAKSSEAKTGGAKTATKAATTKPAASKSAATKSAAAKSAKTGTGRAKTAAPKTAAAKQARPAAKGKRASRASAPTSAKA